jgi:hypothetical protein
MNGEALSCKWPEYQRPAEPNPNFNNPRNTSLCAPADLTAANEVEGFHAFNRARARALISKTAQVMRRGDVA